MANVDHLNPPYARTPPKTETTLLHSRDLSTVSNVTLFTTTTTHSHPSEPLLQATTPQTVNYEDQPEPDHIPTDRDEPIGRLPCEAPLMIHDNPMNKAEKQGYWARNRPRTKKHWKWLILGLRAALSTWAIYNTVRYFIAFSDLGDPTIQTLCLALGTSTGVSFLLTFSSFLLSIRDGLTYLSYVRTTMDYLSSFCLTGPAVVNFALIFIWKKSQDPYWNVDNRCHFDVDIIWSVSNTLCNNKSPYWAIWLTASALRLAFTLIFTIGYHIISSLNYGSRHQRAIRGFRARISDDLYTLERAPSSFNPHRDLVMLQSESTLCGISRSEPSPQNQIRLERSHSSSLSQDISPTEPLAVGRPLTTESEIELLPNEFVDRSQPIAFQIAQETDQVLDLAHSNHSPSPETMNGISTRDLPPSYKEDWDDFKDARVGLSHNNGNNIFNLPPVFPALGYNEFGLPYPPDQNVRMLNGYVRRMPTIESMGSGSSVGASSNRAVESILNSSRPPTRNTLLSLHSTDYDSPNSEPPSRTNSLSARAELFVGLSNVPNNNISEHGELLGRTSPAARRLSSPLSYVDYTVSDNTTSTATSGASSYHTVTSEPFQPGLLTLDTRSKSPVLGQPP